MSHTRKWQTFPRAPPSSMEMGGCTPRCGAWRWVRGRCTCWRTTGAAGTRSGSGCWRLHWGAQAWIQQPQHCKQQRRRRQQPGLLPRLQQPQPELAQHLLPPLHPPLRTQPHHRRRPLKRHPPPNRCPLPPALPQSRRPPRQLHLQPHLRLPSFLGPALSPTPQPGPTQLLTLPQTAPQRLSSRRMHPSPPLPQHLLRQLLHQGWTLPLSTTPPSSTPATRQPTSSRALRKART
mmetsp:Transcript_19444/g.39652  ORF Transcript_19444/g.39652 Transcript_19444/m.39652 type:complete len:234 (-) Transcript_19444:1006-1707(-)